MFIQNVYITFCGLKICQGLLGHPICRFRTATKFNLVGVHEQKLKFDVLHHDYLDMIDRVDAFSKPSNMHLNYKVCRAILTSSSPCQKLLFKSFSRYYLLLSLRTHELLLKGPYIFLCAVVNTDKELLYHWPFCNRRGRRSFFNIQCVRIGRTRFITVGPTGFIEIISSATGRSESQPFRWERCGEINKEYTNRFKADNLYHF